MRPRVDADAALPRREPQRGRALDARSSRPYRRCGQDFDPGRECAAQWRKTMSFLVRLPREMPRFSYFNVEVPFAAAKPRTLTDAGGEAILGPFDGEEAIAMMPDLDAGASATMPGALLPDLLRPVIDHHTRGRRREAALPVVN